VGDDVRHDHARDAGEDALPLAAEQLSVSKETCETGRVRVSRRTHERQSLVDERLLHERVEVETIPVGREIDTAPVVRQEGDTTIIPVVEEVLVTQRRLILKEEIRVTRVKTTVRVREIFPLRCQEAVVERCPVDSRGAGTPPR
jgi:uncharacterized protein (TIGR02271 family)